MNWANPFLKSFFYNQRIQVRNSIHMIDCGDRIFSLCKQTRRNVLNDLAVIIKNQDIFHHIFLLYNETVLYYF